MRLAFATVLAVLLMPLAAAGAARRAPCVEGASKPLCRFWDAEVTFVADGDTIRADIKGVRGNKTIRFTGINAMELTRYSKYPSRRRGACHGLEATALVSGRSSAPAGGSGWRRSVRARTATGGCGGRCG